MENKLAYDSGDKTPLSTPKGLRSLVFLLPSSSAGSVAQPGIARGGAQCTAYEHLNSDIRLTGGKSMRRSSRTPRKPQAFVAGATTGDDYHTDAAARRPMARISTTTHGPEATTAAPVVAAPPAATTASQRSSAGWQPPAPSPLLFAALCVYLSTCARGLSFLFARVFGGIRGQEGGVPSYEDSKFWLLLVAGQYFFECVLVLACGVTVFPRWRRPDLLTHHLPFALFIFASVAWVPSWIWDTYPWTQSTILALQGNEVLETLQTLGVDRVLLGDAWVTKPTAASSSSSSSSSLPSSSSAAAAPSSSASSSSAPSSSSTRSSSSSSSSSSSASSSASSASSSSPAAPPSLASSPGLFEKARLLYAFLGLSACLCAELFEVSRGMYWFFVSPPDNR